MRNLLLCLVATLTLGTYGWPQEKSGACSDYNTTFSYPFSMGDSTEHIANITYGHSLSTVYNRNCSYFSGSSAACNTSCLDDGRSAIATYENASTMTYAPIYHHVINKSAVTGSGFGNNGGVNCGSTVAVAATSCLISVPCTATVSISASANGIGASVSFPPGTIWPDSNADVTVCNAEQNPNYGGRTSPIIFNLGGGYHLSLLKDGVVFDFFGKGPVLVSWPEKGADNGFLVLPDQHGMVTSALQMFGNLTPQPPSPDPNGFLALAQYDQAAKGGNGDGVISPQDQIWRELRIWVDTNHDGVSQPGELHTLDELGIDSISLKYTNSPYIDDNGNAFRYKGSAVTDCGSKDCKVAVYDVFLQFGSIPQ